MKSIFTHYQKSIFVIGIIFCSFFVYNLASAASYYWVGASGSSVSASSNWATSTGGLGGAGVPGSADTVIFDSGGNTNATISANWTISTTTITSGYTQVITQNSGTTWTMNAGFINSSNSNVLNSAGTVTFYHQNNSPTITTGGITFNNLTLSSYNSCNGNYVTTLTDSFTVNGTTTVSFWDTCGNGRRNFVGSSAININALGNFVINGGGYYLDFGTNINVNLSGNNKSFTSTSIGNINANFNFNGTGTTTINKAGPATTGTTTINQSSGAVELSGNSLFYNLVIDSGKINASASNYNITINGNFTNNAGSSGFDARNGTVTFSSTASTNKVITTGGINFYNLTFAGGWTYNATFADSFTVLNNLTTNVGTTGGSYGFSASSPVTISVGGNFSMNASGNSNSYFGNSNITLNMIGDNKSFITATNYNYFRANLNFNGTGITTVNKADTADQGTTTINQSAGSVVLSGNSKFYNLVINSGNKVDVSTSNYGLTINGILINNAGSSGFDARNGTVIFSSTASTNKVVTTGGINFYNLTFAGGWTYNTTFMDSCTTTNNLLISAGSTGGSYVFAANSPVTISVGGNFTMTTSGNSNIYFGNTNVTLNMTGANKSFTVATNYNYFRANIIFNGTGITSVNKSGMVEGGILSTTTINQSSGSVALSGNSMFFNFIINSGAVFDASYDGITSYNLTVNGNFIDLGTLIPRSGTVIFDSSVGSTLLAGSTFNNVTFTNNQGTTGSVGLRNTLNINGNLSVNKNYYAAFGVYGVTPVTVNLAGNFNMADNGGYNYTTFGSNVAANQITLNMTGNNKSFTETGVLNNPAYFRADLNINGTGTTTINKYIRADAGTTTINQTSGAVVLGGNSLFYNLVVNSGSTLNDSVYTLTTNNNLTVNSGGKLALSGAALTVAGAFNVSNTGTFALLGNETVSKCPTSAAGGIVSYVGTSTTPYTIKNCTYSVLAINGNASSTFALGATTTVTTTNINTGTLSLNGYGFTTTNFSNDATLKLKGSETVTITNFDTNSGIVEYVGDGDTLPDTYTIKPFNYYNLYINSIDHTSSTTDAYSAASVPRVYNNLIVYNGTLTNYGSVPVDGQLILMNEFVPPTVSTPITILPGAVSGNYFSGTISLRSSISDTGSLLKLNSCKVSFNGGVWINTGVTQDALYCHYNDITPNASFSLAFGVSDNANNFGTSTTVNFIYNGKTASSTFGFGGIVGYQDGGSISNSYANGSVTGTKDAGGLVGYQNSGSILNSYSIATISGTTFPGGLVGWQNAGTVESSFWDTVASGIADSFVGDGRTTSDMKNENTFSGWSPSIWNIIAGSYPVLR